ncbi:MAG TPA: hypothetical protein VFY87_16180 [Geminicoccaceae bacterium]|nr:hypothetical protein [Geminicoccaceae bacterium]
MLVGHARVSTQEQDLALLQLDALEAVGCGKVLEETARGAGGPCSRRRSAPRAPATRWWDLLR